MAAWPVSLSALKLSGFNFTQVICSGLPATEVMLRNVRDTSKEPEATYRPVELNPAEVGLPAHNETWTTVHASFHHYSSPPASLSHIGRAFARMVAWRGGGEVPVKKADARQRYMWWQQQMVDWHDSYENKIYDLGNLDQALNGVVYNDV